MAMASSTGGAATPTRHCDGSRQHSDIAVVSEHASSARERLQAPAMHRCSTNPHLAGHLIHSIVINLESELFGLTRWRRASEHGLIREHGR